MYMNIYLTFKHVSNSMNVGIFGHTYSTFDSDAGCV